MVNRLVKEERESVGNRPDNNKGTKQDQRLARIRHVTKKTKDATTQLDLELVQFTAGSTAIDFNFDMDAETIWATQQQIADLFGVQRPAISKHINNIYADGELTEEAVCSILETTAADGKYYEVAHYNLDLILSVGYRVSSARATQFRQWANSTLKAYLRDGYALNESRLRESPAALRELAAKLRELRSGEKQIYEAVRDCFKISASDYDKGSQSCHSFYAKLQDKFLFACTGLTAAEIILERADGKKANMGLITMKGDVPTLADATIGKNYLVRDELYTVHILCEQFLLYAESKALRGQKMTMAELSKKLDALLETNDYPVFTRYKEYLRDRAVRHAKQELARYLSLLKSSPARKALSAA